MGKRIAFLLGLALLVSSKSVGRDTLPSLDGIGVPKSVEALWAKFDPRREPLDVEVLKEWEEDGVVMQVLRYRIGVFKGQKAMMAAVYGYPKGGKKLPEQAPRSSIAVEDTPENAWQNEGSQYLRDALCLKYCTIVGECDRRSLLRSCIGDEVGGTAA